VEDVRAKAVRALVRALGEDERLIEERDRLRDAGLVVADDADEEHDLGPVRVGEPGGDRYGCRRLEHGHRLLELAGSDEGPCLSRHETKLERRRARGARGLARRTEHRERVVVPVRLEQQFGGAQVGLEPLHVGPAETVLEVLRVRLEPTGEPFERLARRPGLAALDLTDVLLREATGGELGLAQAGGTAQQTHALTERARSSVERRIPVLPRHASHGGMRDGL